jgi:cytochrome c553
MRPLIRWTGIGLSLVLLLLFIAAGYVYVGSERRLRRTYEATPTTLVPATDSASIARGAHLANAVTTCTLCHAADGGGAIYADEGPLGIIVGPNLTRGRGGVGDRLTDADWVRAVRHGVRANGRSLIVMPSEVFAHLSDRDLAALIAYYRQLPPVDRELPATRFGPLGRALLATGRLNLLVAPKTPQVTPVEIEPSVSTEYGRYLADISGCHGCHGYGLSGGRVAGPPGLPPAANLTPAGAMAQWTEADFARGLRTGVRPDGTVMDEFMPWRVYAGMTKDELSALWLYLRSVPAKPFGNK